MPKTTSREVPAVVLAAAQADPVLVQAIEDLERNMKQRPHAKGFGESTAALFLHDLGRYLSAHRATYPMLWKGRP